MDVTQNMPQADVAFALQDAERLFLVTGAAGHLGRAVVQQLLERGARVRALVLPGDDAALRLPQGAELFYGDVTDLASLAPAFACACGERLTVIHAAGIVAITSRPDKRIWQVNVEGTRNIVRACCAHGARLVYVSSVHALPEAAPGATVTETTHFDPDAVEGAYAKTKAAATRLVLNAVHNEGLDACIVHPSGIAGPGDCGRGHITQLALDYCGGALPAGVHGGYDFVDVRDVAAGILAAADRGRTGECYLLTNRYCAVADLLELFHQATGRKRVRVYLPLWLAKTAVPFAGLWYRLKKRPPLFTRYSLYTLSSNAMFSHEKADRELGYTTRPMAETVRDTVAWLAAEGRIQPQAGPARRKKPQKSLKKA